MPIRSIKSVLLFSIAAFPLLTGTALPVAAETTLCTAITRAPTVISRPGHYCLKKDLRFTPLQGTAIDVRVGNVVLDMNGHYIRGDVSTDNLAVGITVRNKPNVRISNGVLTHFGKGLFAIASSGLLVENMNVLNSKEAAVMFDRTKASVIRDSRFLNNLVEIERGKSTTIFTSNTDGTRIINNDISNTGITSSDAIKIDLGTGKTTVIENNRITGTAAAAIVIADGSHATIQGNTVANARHGVLVLIPSGITVARDNTFVNVEQVNVDSFAVDGGGNVVGGPVNGS